MFDERLVVEGKNKNRGRLRRIYKEEFRTTLEELGIKWTDVKEWRGVWKHIARFTVQGDCKIFKSWAAFYLA